MSKSGQSGAGGTFYTGMCGDAGGTPLDSPRLPPHIGTAARKHGLAAGRQRSCMGRWEIGNFGLFRSVTKWVRRAGAVRRPARRFAFCDLSVRFGNKIPAL